jgi:ABC transporter substrate binding protein
VIVVNTSVIVAIVQQATQTEPIVFVGVIDPVGAGFVASLARPGGNTTGFALFEFGISGKWLSLLKEIAPSRAAVLRDPSTAAGIGQLGAIRSLFAALYESAIGPKQTSLVAPHMSALGGKQT